MQEDWEWRKGVLGLAMRRTSPRRFVPLAALCVATVVSLVLAAVTKLGDTEQSFSEIVGVGERRRAVARVSRWRAQRSSCG